MLHRTEDGLGRKKTGLHYPFVILPVKLTKRNPAENYWRFRGFIPELSIEVFGESPEEVIGMLDEKVQEVWNDNCRGPSQNILHFSTELSEYVARSGVRI